MEELFQKIARSENPASGELVEFTRDLEQFLARVLAESDFGFLWESDQSLLNLAKDAFRESVEQAGAQLRDVIWKVTPEAVRAHGLSGAALKFKLNVVAAITRRWNQVKGTLGVRGWFKQMVDAIDALLDSLVAAAGVGGALKEFKDALGALAPQQ